MSETVSGTYKTTQWNEVEYSKAEGGARLGVAESELAFSGGLEGTGVRRYSVAHLADGSDRFTGHLAVTAALGGREGSFVLEDSGTGSGPGGSSATWKVVPGTGTGDLSGITGEGTWIWDAGSYEVGYTLTYDL